MQSRKGLTLQFAGAVVLAMMFGASAFAESRHHEGTSRGSSGNINRGSSGQSSGSWQPRGGSVTQSQPRVERGSIQPRVETPRYDSRSADRSAAGDRGFGRDGSADRGRINRDTSPRDGGVQSYEQRGNSPRYDSRNVDRSAGSDRGFGRDRSADRGSVDRGRINRDTTPRDGSVQSYERRGNTNRDWRGNVQRGSGDRGAYGRGNGNYGRNSGNIVLPRGVERDRFHRVEGWHGNGVAPYRNHEFVNSYGRIERYERWHGGYRVWCGGLYPIFVPFDVWTRFPLSVGLYIRFGGYWDPFGYWSVYDYSPYYGNYYPPYYDGGAYTSGVVHGVVESVDYRRGTIVINDDISRQFVTVLMPRDRRMSDVRPGDYVEFSGDWSRGGTFDAYRLERWDYGRGGGYRDDGYRDDDRY